MLWAGVPPHGRMTTTETRRNTPGQAVRKVREGGRMLGSGGDLREVLRHLEITGSTWRRWRRVALRPSCVSGCGTSLSDLPRIKQLNAVDELIARPSLSQPPTASTPEPRSRTGESSTTPTGPTNLSAGSPPPPTLTTGRPTSTNQHTYRSRTHKRVPLSC